MKITEKVVVGKLPDNIRINFDEIPKHQMDALCRVILRGAREAYKNPEFMAEYERRVAARKAKGNP